MAKYRQLFSKYLNLNDSVSAQGFSSCNCPFHDDRTASAAVQIEKGIFTCRACDVSYGAVRFIQHFSQVPYEEALEIVEDYRRQKELIVFDDKPEISKYPSTNPNWDKLVETSRKLLEDGIPPIFEEYCISRGIKVAHAVERGIGFLPEDLTHWKRESLVFPYTYDGKIVGVRYRDEEGSRSCEPGSHFPLWGIDDLDGMTGTCILTEGESDRLRVLQELNGMGLPVVSAPSATFDEKWRRELSDFDSVILIPHQDEAGNGMTKKCYSSLGSRLTVVNLEFRRREPGKDICDWLRFHKPEELKQTIVKTYRPRQVLTGLELSQMKTESRDYIIDPIIGRSQIVVIGGAQKQMKTWLMYGLIRCAIQKGENFCGIPNIVNPGKSANVLIVEEEGDRDELNARAHRTLSGTNWKYSTWWMHHMGVKLDEKEWINRISTLIEQHKIELLILDPLQRLHSADENSSSEMLSVWNNIHALTVKFPQLSVVIIHHFHKQGKISDGWSAFRGSSRTAAEADLGVFVEKFSPKEGVGIRVKFDGRNLKPFENGSRGDIFRLNFNDKTGLFDYKNDAGFTIGKEREFIDEMKERMEWDLNDCAAYFKISSRTITNWVEKRPFLKKQPGGNGRTAKIFYLPEEDPSFEESGINDEQASAD